MLSVRANRSVKYMLKLMGTDGTRLYSFDLAPGSYQVGRSAENSIHIPDKTVSRKHATVEVAASGDEVYITDTGSHNGTMINDVRIASRTEVKSGDRIAFGKTDFKIQSGEGKEAARPRQSTTLANDNDIEKSVFLTINEALMPLPQKVTDLPELFPTLSEMARILVLNEPREAMLERSLALVNKVIPAERLAVLMNDDEKDEIYSAATLLPDGRERGTFRLSRTIANEILTEKNAILIGNPRNDPRFAEQQSIIMSELRSAMAVPLFDEGEVLGILYVDTTNPVHQYNDDYLRLLATFGNIIASRLLNYTLIQDRQERKIYDAELKRASEIQKNLLRSEDLDVPGYKVNAFQVPCRAVGGDLYDIAKLPDGRLVLLVADVSGKGMGAALLMANILASFRILYNVSEFSLTEVVSLVSEQLFNRSAAADFATLFVGVLDPKENEMTYINAGHNPPLLVRGDGQREYLQASGTMIGAFDINTWSEAKTTINFGDLLFVFSDGVTEAERDNQQYSEERMEAAVCREAGKEPAELVRSLMDDIEKFLQDAPRTDDITMLAVKRME